MTQGLCQEDELFFTHPNIRRYPLFDEKKYTLHKIILPLRNGRMLLSPLHKEKNS